MAYSNRGPRSVREREVERILKLALRASKAARELEQAAFETYVVDTREYKLALSAQVAVGKFARAFIRKVEA